MNYNEIAFAFEDADGLDQIKDFQSLLTGPECVGFWRFDNPAALKLTDGRVEEIANWKVGGVPMVQAAAARRAPVVYDDVLKRNVGRFVRADTSFYTASGYVFNPAAVYSWVAVVWIDDFAAFNQVCGQYISTPNRVQMQTGTNTMRHLYGDAAVQGPITAGAWVRVIVSLGVDLKPKIRIGNAAPIIGVAPANAPAPASINLFQMGGSVITLGGKLDLLGKYNIDLLATGNAPMLANLDEYLTLRSV
ncbi:hypothetical protein ASG40_13045 [Methylobacterium sp. Leaf399]|uniref:hypothetical protein n=1 Tax=unclassified Methylobacterium TaxID=2615210 RepID=UPI0006FBA959|nr:MULTISPECIES: hypothetical protein [unclassified Methylobacterium]KQP50847.1 hypothetical protein ASF39_11425 [Methylobacterium sp. Leaf108]KQT07828.1 hypothetical protein ASG40_13045 [Methylobacterium sp. Leaf399]KQT88943.1 hypothetical protein ASG59_13815 [Methylobacterium sp. Leaf466]